MNALVNIVMVTYNHEKFIARAIESVLAQRTSFNYSLIIGEDNSNDHGRSRRGPS
jgi:glycosyltransferase involved in cell wall biosynthesis